MFILNKTIFFLIFFSKTSNLIFCLKTELKFYINNVPSLFRCEKNGPLLYFNHFPNDDEFHQNLTKINSPCDLSLTSIDQRAVMKLNRLELLCEILHKKDYVNEFLFFSSECSIDLCRKFLPVSVRILTEYPRGDMNIDEINLSFHVNRSTEIIIGQLTNNIKKNRTWKNGDIRTNQIVFEYEKNNYLNMMCESTNGFCHQYLWNQSANVKNDWSWICYYYPSETENPLDHNMIYRAVEEFEKTNPETTRILLRKFEVNLDNSSSSSSSLNGTNTDLSKSSTSVLLFLILSMSICGTYCFCKNKTNNEVTKTVNRSSEESEYSQESLEEIFIE